MRNKRESGTITRSRDEQKEVYWRRQFEEREASGLSVSKYCARIKVNAHNFRWWRREIKRRDSEPPLVDKRYSARNDNTVDQSSIVKPDLRPGRGALEIVLPGGASITVTTSTSMFLLARVLKCKSPVKNAMLEPADRTNGSPLKKLGIEF